MRYGTSETVTKTLYKGKKESQHPSLHKHNSLLSSICPRLSLFPQRFSLRFFRSKHYSMDSFYQKTHESSDIDRHVMDGDKRKRSSNSLSMLKKPKVEEFDSTVPAGFITPVLTAPPQPLVSGSNPVPLAVVFHNNENNQVAAAPFVRGCKQFWKAGDYEESSVSYPTHSAGWSSC